MPDIALQIEGRELKERLLLQRERDTLEREIVPLGKDLLLFLKRHLMNPHNIAVQGDMRPQTVERWLKGKSEASKRDTVYGILDQINSGLERFGKRAEYVRGREYDYLEISDIPTKTDFEPSDGLDWLDILKDIQVALREEDPQTQKDLAHLIRSFLQSTPDQRRTLVALDKALGESMDR